MAHPLILSRDLSHDSWQREWSSWGCAESGSNSGWKKHKFLPSPRGPRTPFWPPLHHPLPRPLFTTPPISRPACQYVPWLLRPPWPHASFSLSEYPFPTWKSTHSRPGSNSSSSANKNDGVAAETGEGFCRKWGAYSLHLLIFPLRLSSFNFCSQGLSTRKGTLNRFPRAHLRVWLDPKPQGLISDLLLPLGHLRSLMVSEGWRGNWELELG